MKTQVQKVETRIKEKQERVCYAWNVEEASTIFI